MSGFVYMDVQYCTVYATVQYCLYSIALTVTVVQYTAIYVL